jgi:hypothetical protein
MNTTLNREHKAVRYRFRGLIRDTGKAVEGHVEADSEEFAFHLLANNGIVTESLHGDPRPEDIRQPTASAKSNLLPPLVQAMLSGKRPAPQAQPLPASPPAADATTKPYVPPPVDNSPIPGTREVVNAIDTALDTSSSQIEFDALTERYRGKKVWVIDRDKIKRNVARVVDQAITDSLKNADNAADTRKSVAEAIEKLFTDNRNLTSPQGSANAGSGQGGINLDRQIERLSSVIKNFENSLASMQMAIRNIGAGGGGGGAVPRRNMGQSQQPGLREEQNAVLLEIFKTNMDLLRNMEDEMRSANTTVESVTASTAG